MKGGRRSVGERLAGLKCHDQKDPISLDDIPVKFAIRLLENGVHQCFDVRSLFEWFKTGNRTNPLTNLNFSPSNIDKIQRKFVKAGLDDGRVPFRFLDSEILFIRSLDGYTPIAMHHAGTRSYDIISVDRWVPRRFEGPDSQIAFPDCCYEIMPTFSRDQINIFTKNAKTYKAVLREMVDLLGEPNDYVRDGAIWWEQ